ncbi:DUF928 domain-containing protein [Aetokthonos hydrillicola Thurmond2011]|jgi:hypothetical protein|uniref:DUF928 domain-containing protein n=1 Tax=Aetokthonos hydrillicola Thurmond2011 TaxID=2712845 RepID=A0AAP5IHC1_9CYAN|nr:DUF928 domain-containing protein [Aetokthonos hydrillicola]MBO3457221.1 DUF928 domain-containing protein [Aetokthonos hydrillicola CCALA 1050]MBW4587571.1 DUF928 domain-containing protein [Aetokthonos hydrillicola CCALA 1050]MDR9900163.1 DUF928 domain-containing protein [Aetokthonos hydrillicola Thurmond2011]
MKPRYLLSVLTILTLIMSGVWGNANAYAVTFIPPANNSPPSQATGGASRGNFFTPVYGKGAPKQTTGGASRGNLFTPSSSNSAPKQATGGASRGDLFTPSSGNSAPKQASGGASRSGDDALNPTLEPKTPAKLIALLPQSFYGTTVSEHPTILVYLPASNAQKAIFSLKDEAGKMQYQMTIPVAGKTGVISVNLPKDAPPLAIGKNYQWFLAVEVDGRLNPSTPYVDGWIERVQPSADLATAMEQKDALKRAAAFGKNGVWYDCAATLVSLHSAQPNNAILAKQWEELLSSVGLKEVTTAPFVVSAE